MAIANAAKGCPCSDESATLAAVQGQGCQLSSGERGIQLTVGGSCVPLSYGSSRCVQHDLLHDPACRLDPAGETLVPSHCIRPFCFVDPEVCKRYSDEIVYRSSYFPQDSGVDLFYSYSTCNSTADDWLSIQDEIVGNKNGALGGIGIVASIPAYQNPLMFKRDPITGKPLNAAGDEYYNNSVGYEGFYPEYIKSMVRISNGDIKDVEYTYTSRSSRLLHPSSSYTATVQDIENGLIDMGVGPFWVTSQRLTMVAFTIPILYDKTFLVVPLSHETFSDILLKVFSPFTLGAWVCVLMTILASALFTVWFSDLYNDQNSREGRKGSNTPQYRRIAAYARLAVDQVLEKGVFFCSAGIEQDGNSSLPTRILMTGFAAFILIVVSAYVANLAAFLTQSISSGVTTIEGAVKNSVTICAHPAVKRELEVAWPKGDFYYSESGKEVLGMIEDFEAKKCEALAIGWEDNTVDETIRKKLCENELRFTNSLIIETPAAFPISPKIAPGISFWMLELEKKHGISIRTMSEQYLEEVNQAQSCPLKLSEQRESSDYEKVTFQNLLFPLIFYVACLGIAIILQLVHMHYQKKGVEHSIIGRKSQLNYTTNRPSVLRQRNTKRKDECMEDDRNEVSSIQQCKTLNVVDNSLPQWNALYGPDGVLSNDEIESTVKSLYVGDMKEIQIQSHHEE